MACKLTIILKNYTAERLKTVLEQLESQTLKEIEVSIIGERYELPKFASLRINSLSRVSEAIDRAGEFLLFLTPNSTLYQKKSLENCYAECAKFNAEITFFQYIDSAKSIAPNLDRGLLMGKAILKQESLDSKETLYARIYKKQFFTKYGNESVLDALLNEDALPLAQSCVKSSQILLVKTGHIPEKISDLCDRLEQFFLIASKNLERADFTPLFVKYSYHYAQKNNCNRKLIAVLQKLEKQFHIVQIPDEIQIEEVRSWWQNLTNLTADELHLKFYQQIEQELKKELKYKIQREQELKKEVINRMEQLNSMFVELQNCIYNIRVMK